MPQCCVRPTLATRRGGTTVSIGLPPPDARLDLSALTLVAEERRLLGCYLGSAVPSRDVPRYLALYRAHDAALDTVSHPRQDLYLNNDKTERNRFHYW